MSFLVVTGNNTFACTYEGDDHCLLSHDSDSDSDDPSEAWDRVSGNGFTADNTMNNGE